MHFWVPGISGPARLKTKLGQKAQEAIARYVPREASFMLAVQSIYQSHQDISRWFIIYIYNYIYTVYIYTYNYIYIYTRIVYIRYTMIYIIIKIEVSCPVFGICVAILSKQRVEPIDQSWTSAPDKAWQWGQRAGKVCCFPQGNAEECVRWIPLVLQ